MLCGAVPVYVNPEVDKRLGISLGMKREQVAKAIKEHPSEMPRDVSKRQTVLAPGERITKEILNYIEYAKAKGCSMTGPEDPEILHLNVLA